MFPGKTDVATLLSQRPIAAVHNGIRLLLLRPGRFLDDIQSDLIDVCFDDQLKYEALSYTWGDGKTKRPIRVSGSRLDVSANLEVALRHLRPLTTTRVLWIDALCINQGDYEERSDQVKKMFQIYRRATNVIAWLGKESRGSGDSMALVTDFAMFLRGNGVVDLESAQNFNNRAKKSRKGPSGDLNNLGFPFKEKKRDWESLWKLLRRPYWSRMWILQELAARGYWGSRDSMPCTLQCGSHTASMHDLQMMFDHFNIMWSWYSPSEVGDWRLQQPFKSFTRQGFMDPPGFTMCATLRLFHLDRAAGRSTLKRLLHLSHPLDASEDRDKMYALLGLVSENYTISPDYTISLSDILIHYVRNSVETDGSLNALFSNRLYPCESGLPTWTPEIRNKWHAPCQWEKHGVDTLFKASGNKKADVEFIPYQDLNQDSVILRAKGVVIGEIDHVIGPCRIDDLVQRTIMTRFSSFIHRGRYELFMMELSRFASDLENGSADYGSFWRTLVLNRNEDVNDTRQASKGLRIGGVIELRRDWLQAKEMGEVVAGEDGVKHRNTFRRCVYRCVMNRTFFRARGHSYTYMGLGPYDARPGDLAVVLFGSDQCLVLRPRGEGLEGYNVIGTAYVHGAMRGELVEEQDVQESVFDLY
ncbi:unnamed protein product [Clonostachys byssicola]|uniref:Heterokaryon incompatibility domain-containing protein n=1 Tax=Clonostachys byssicola TaxID=160290 RepID=A0A9N9UKJ9_9HYPO|nr:unnamed protein product [Clonostachys byssicola]